MLILGTVHLTPKQNPRCLNNIFSPYHFSLIFGLCCSILTIYAKGWRSQHALLGSISGTAIYANIETHQRAVELPNIKIFQYIGAINFASSTSFKRALNKKILENKAKTIRDVEGIDNCEVLKKLQPHALIIDLSCVTHIDVAACKVFAEIQTDQLLSNTILYLTGPNDRLLETIRHAECLSVGCFSVFPSIHDAVLYFQSSVSDSE